MRTISRRRWALSALMLWAVLLLVPGSWVARAQEPAPLTAASLVNMDARWAPWLGCWQLIEEGSREGAVPIAAVDSLRWPLNPLRARLNSLQLRRAAEQGAADVRVCVVPGDSIGAVRVRTQAGSLPLLEETIMADGVRRPVQDSNCVGWRQAEWSRNGARLFLRAEVACQGEGPRTVSGIALMAPAGVWVDIQVVDLEGRESVRVKRYRRAPDDEGGNPPSSGAGELGSPPAALLAAASRFDVQDVVEASSRVGATAVEAALVETASEFELDSGTLIQLEEAGVAGRVIDVMVALSYPERFIIQRALPAPPLERGRSASSRTVGAVGSTYDRFDSWRSSAFDSYYYSPFGYWPFLPGWVYSSSWYSPWSPYGPLYLGGPSTIIVTPPRGNNRREEAIEPGRVINGRGYTRVRPRGASGSAAESSSAPSSQPQPAGGDTTSRAGSTRSSGGSSSSSSSAGGAVSPQGASRGGTGSSSSGEASGRTAKPR